MNIQRNSGFTLLEMIIAISIISIATVLITNVLFTTLKNNTKVELVKTLKQNGDFALSSIDLLIRNADSVASTCSQAGTTLDSISIVNRELTTTSIECVDDNSILRIASVSGGITEYLTSDSITISGASCASSSLQFICYSTPDSDNKINISFSLKQIGTPVEQVEIGSVSFQTSVNTR